jgi:integrase
MRQAGPGRYVDRTRGLIAILWRAGLRISEVLALTESDLDPKTGSVLVRGGKGGKRRTVGWDDWAWEHAARWTEHRIQLPIGPLFCILAGPTRGRGCSAADHQGQLGHTHLGITSIYLQGIDTREIVDTVHRRRPPVIPASAGLRP